LFPAWIRQAVRWVISRFCDDEEEAEEESLMSGASAGWGSSYTYSSGWQSSYTYDEDVEESEHEGLWEDRRAWDSIEGRMVEMGLS
jgi:hypothetical protein